jgi:hypothetical protein
MTRIAVTGHRSLAPDLETAIDQAIRAELARFAAEELVGLSCLADGADQIFARAVLDLGGRLEAVIPAARYRDAMPAEALAAYDELLQRAAQVHRLDHVESTSQAHMDASDFAIMHADLLFAIWDRQPSLAFAGTADVVARAREVGMPVTVIWPRGASRTRDDRSG